MAGYQRPVRSPWSRAVFTDCARLLNSANNSGVVVGSGASGLKVPGVNVTLSPVWGEVFAAGWVAGGADPLADAVVAAVCDCGCAGTVVVADRVGAGAPETGSFE